MEKKIESLLEQMTLEEKVSMVAGSDTWHSTGVERLGVPSFKMTDGPNGARGAQMTGGPSSACFPVGICLASTWNTDLLYRVGAALGEEVKSKSAHILLGPTVNIHRSPLNGRNFECYSEDPYLTARLAVAYIQGVQSQGVGACIKHFVCNDSEFERNSISSEVGERALREIYLPPFKAAVKEAGVWSVMGAYNRLNGTFCCEHPYTLTEILKDEWEFDGIVISDWMGTKSTADSANGGLDLEMPGPARFMGQRLLKSVRDGQVSEETIDGIVCRLLRTTIRAGVMEHPEGAEQSIDKPEHRRLIREAAGEGIVLLKNEGNLLPLDENEVKTMAIVGPNVRAARIMGGGSAHVNAHRSVSPLEGVVERCGESVEIRYELGCTNHKSTPILDAAWLTPASGEGTGLTIEYYNSLDLSGEPVLTEVSGQMRMIWFGQFSPVVDREQFSVRLSGKLTIPETSRYTFSLSSAGLSRLCVDGEKVIDNWTGQQPRAAFDGIGGAEAFAELDLVAGRPYEIEVEYSRMGATFIGALQVGCLPAIPEDIVERAVQAAAESDVALVFIGTSGEWESEGFDRPDMELPGRQVELLEKVAAVNPNTVAVLNTGSPIAMRWLDRVPAVVEAWFPGQECGHAIADVLFGDVNPSGRLSQTFPVRLEDNPAYINYPGENGKVVYGEGIFVGYRYYDRKKIEPLFPFGYGLSYTSFEYSNLAIDKPEIGPGDEVEVTVDVTNTGQRAGKEVVQLYVHDVESSLTRPEKELKAFAKVALEPGETKTVRLVLGIDALSFYDDLKRKWIAEGGEFEVLVGASSRDIRARGTFQLSVPPEEEKPAQETPASGKPLTKASVLRDILDDPQGEAVLRKHLGEMLDAPQLGMAMGFTLEQIAPFVPHILTQIKLDEIDRDLRSLTDDR